MWLKVFGLVCAGVFVGAAYREVTEYRRAERKAACPQGKRCRHRAESCAEEGDDDASRQS